jgi:hypothetical protein
MSVMKALRCPIRRRHRIMREKARLAYPWYDAACPRCGTTVWSAKTWRGYVP